MSQLDDRFEQLRADVNAMIDHAKQVFASAPPLPEDLVNTSGASYSESAGIGWPGWRKVQEGTGAMIAIRWDVNQWLQNMPALVGAIFEHPEHGRWQVGEDGTLIKQE